MKEYKEPHEQLTVQDNQLTATQEVMYHDEFKRADAAGKKGKSNNENKK